MQPPSIASHICSAYTASLRQSAKDSANLELSTEPNKKSGWNSERHLWHPSASQIDKSKTSDKKRIVCSGSCMTLDDDSRPVGGAEKVHYICGKSTGRQSSEESSVII
jgi:hypothetical protein